ncbi:hypothetical protein FRC11_012839 [Ceratobasidium sp. 423]|nr:hypothetical protein FRC11_012839 [Ceratobasidium sp. 423]
MDDPQQEGLRALSPNPDREEIDNWMEDMKRYRSMQVKKGIRIAPIHCPLPTCGKGQRRPQALHDHLYFHFGIKHELHTPRDSIYSPLNGDPDQSTSRAGGSQDITMDDPQQEGLRALSPNPDQEEIDNWIEDMKRYRSMQVKEGIRVAPIHCPLPTCGKGQRRPQALRDHLYFHFGIKRE